MTVSFVSSTSAGQGAQGASVDPDLSGNGLFVAFDSVAGNLSGGTTNGFFDVFVKSLTTGALQLVSVGSGGARGNSSSTDASLSRDGTIVAFESIASNLVSGDTNGQPDIFVRNLSAGTTVRVSTSSSGGQANASSASLGSYDPSIDGAGRYVAFASDATDLVSGDTNARTDIFVKDLTTGAIQRVSLGSGGAQGNSYSYNPSISADGNVVVFTSESTNLVSGDTNFAADIFAWNRGTGAVTRVSTSSSGTQATGSTSWASNWARVSDDGRYVVFESDATNLVSGDTNGKTDVFVKDLSTGATTRVSTGSGGAQGDNNSGAPDISGNGRFVSFTTTSSNFYSGDTASTADAFIKDLQTGTLTRLNIPVGSATNIQFMSTFPSPVDGAGRNSIVSVADNGTTVAFSAIDSVGAFAGNTSNQTQIFVNSGLPGGSSPLPDLQITSFSLDRTVFAPGDSGVATWTIKNAGTAAAASADGYLVLSHDAVFGTPGGALFGADDSGRGGQGGLPGGSQLAAGASAEVTHFAFTIPADLAPGTYHFALVADAFAHVTESDENNNFSTIIPITVTGSGGTNTYNGHTYTYVPFNDTAQTFAQARSAALAMGGYLANVTSQGEADHIVNNVIAGKYPHDEAAAFIGGSDAAQEGVWKWISGPEAGTTFWNGGPSGTAPGGAYANWASGEPNNFTGNAEGSENYLVFGIDGHWIDVPASRSANATAGYIVEFSSAARVKNDFDGDRHADILFSNAATNFSSDYLWMMNDRAIGSQGAIDLFDKAFTVQVAGDFDGDGKTDVLFENPTTGGVYAWLLDGKTIKSQGAVDVADNTFHILGTGDFNGDGRDDVIFRNDAGFLYQWQMNGRVDTPKAIGALDPAWRVAGAGDFDGDGKADLLLHNVSNTAANGAYFLWGMDGNVIKTQAGIERPDSQWHTLGVGDFDGDGKADFAIRNESASASDGAVWIYLMDGATIKAQGAVGIANAAEFQLAGIGDYNGDGKDDILFRNDAGYFYSWNMDGSHIASEGLLQGAAQWAPPSQSVVTQHWDLV